MYIFLNSFGLSKKGVSKVCDRLVDGILIALENMIPTIDEEYIQTSKQRLIEDGKSHSSAIFLLDGKHCKVKATPIAFHSYKFTYGALQLQILVNRANGQIAALSAGYFGSQHDVEIVFKYFQVKSRS